MAGRGKAARNKFRAGGNKKERAIVRTLDKLAEFEVFDTEVMPSLKRMVLENWSPERIRKHFAPIMQAQMIKKGLQGNLVAIKDTLDRYEGTAVQRVEQKTVYAQMSKRELAALALQKLKDAKLLDTTGRVVKDVKIDEDR